MTLRPFLHKLTIEIHPKQDKKCNQCLPPFKPEFLNPKTSNDQSFHIKAHFLATKLHIEYEDFIAS